MYPMVPTRQWYLQEWKHGLADESLTSEEMREVTERASQFYEDMCVKRAKQDGIFYRSVYVSWDTALCRKVYLESKREKLYVIDDYCPSPLQDTIHCACRILCDAFQVMDETNLMYLIQISGNVVHSTASDDAKKRYEALAHKATVSGLIWHLASWLLRCHIPRVADELTRAKYLEMHAEIDANLRCVSQEDASPISIVDLSKYA